MMKNVTRTLAILLAMLCLVGCGTGDDSAGSGGAGHVHNYSENWQLDDQNHWKECTCGDKKDLAAHTYEDNVCACGVYKPSEGLEFTKSGEYYTLIGSAGNTDTILVIPSEYEGVAVKYIGQLGCTQPILKDIVATKVVIPDGVVQIYDRSFWLCETVEAFEIPASVQRISKYAFWKCSALKEMKLPAGIAVIEEYTFSKCTSLTKVDIPASVTKIEAGAFLDCEALTDINFGGTKAQWEAVEKGYRDMLGNITMWDENTGNYTVHCTDGDVAKA